MAESIDQLSRAARSAAFRRDWRTVAACSSRILHADRESAEGNFLSGLALKARQRNAEAAAAFERVLETDGNRYDAAIELANLRLAERHHAAAAALVERYAAQLGNSPVYSNLAGSILASIGLPDKAWPLFAQASRLQPEADLFTANLAACGVFVGRIEESKALYRRLLERHPGHQRYHYQLSRIETASDARHVETMQRLLVEAQRPPDQNVFMYYAIGKELEDLERWDEAFDYFRKAGDAVARVADYDVQDDLDLIESLITVCNAEWLARGGAPAPPASRVPVFVVGLPRSGTTLVERVLCAHSGVASVGETQYLPMAVREASGMDGDRRMTPAMIYGAAMAEIRRVRDGYLGRVAFRLGEEPLFVDKLPFNLLYLGFIARAFPEARIVLVRRHPMDACFAMYKQVFTGAYKFSYTQEALGRFYPAFRRLVEHWYAVLGERLVTVDYESLVARPDEETRRLLAALGLPFEAACLAFDTNPSATSTASAVQVRRGFHTQSVGRWRRYEDQLRPLRAMLERAGVPLE